MRWSSKHQHLIIEDPINQNLRYAGNICWNFPSKLLISGQQSSSTRILHIELPIPRKPVAWSQAYEMFIKEFWLLLLPVSFPPPSISTPQKKTNQRGIPLNSTSPPGKEHHLPKNPSVCLFCWKSFLHPSFSQSLRDLFGTVERWLMGTSKFSNKNHRRQVARPPLKSTSKRPKRRPSSIWSNIFKPILTTVTWISEKKPPTEKIRSLGVGVAIAAAMLKKYPYI